jgi:flagellar biosynthetic protein FliQ
VSIGEVTQILQRGIFEIFLLAGPLLISALVVGLIVAILQATTSIQEQTLTFVPKMVVILLVLAIFGGLMFSSLGDYTIELFRRIPEMAR